MPTRGNAFDFVDNPSESGDQLPRIPRRGRVSISRRLKTPNTLASIVAMTGKATLAVGTMNDRNQRVNRRNRNSSADVSDTKSSNSKDAKRKLSDEEIKREKQNHERDVNKQKLDDKSAHQQRVDDFVESCTDDVLVDRLLQNTPGGEVHGPWDGGMIRQDVPGDGNCLIHTMLRFSDYDPDEDKNGDVYKAKVSNLREEIHAYVPG